MFVVVVLNKIDNYVYTVASSINICSSVLDDWF